MHLARRWPLQVAGAAARDQAGPHAGRWYCEGMDTAWNQEQGHGLGPDPATVLEVAVLRPGGLASTVHAIPALRHLRKTYPGARITVAVDAASIDLVRACPYVDRCVDIGRPSELVIERFDVAVLLDNHQEIADAAAGTTAGAIRTRRGRRGGGPTLDLVDARCRAAYQHPDHESRYHVYPEQVTRVPEHVRLLRLVWLLGGEQPDASLSLWPSLADRNGAAELVAGIERPIAVLHAGDARSPSRWSRSTFARVAALINDHGLQPVLVGTGLADDPTAVADDWSSSTEWLKESGVVVDLADVPSVGELVGLLERASLFVGADGGAGAIAVALRVQSVVTGAWQTMPSLGTADHVSYLTLVDGDDAQLAASQLEQLLGQVMSSASRAHREWLRTRVR